MNQEYRKDIERFKSQKRVWKRKFQELENWSKNELDHEFHDAHDKVFEEIDCLECANCCSTTSPIFRDVDISRLSKHLGMKPSNFITKYLHLDNEGDYVLNSAPCPFLDVDNKCIVYNWRPQACAEYPHTNRKKMHQILDLTFKNAQMCPATARILNKLDIQL